jgi:hypothetical protein
MSRTNRFTSLTLALGLSFGVAGCDSFLDVNHDPNAPVDVMMELTIPGMQVNFAHDVLGPTWIRYVNMVGATGFGTEWLQQWSDNRNLHTYSQAQWFETSNLDNNGYWSSSYARVMNEAGNIMRRSARDERWKHHGIAKLIYAWNASLLTDAYGPIPFSEALDPTIRAPKYDRQEDIYPQLFTLIDEAIAEFGMPDVRPPSTNDIVFQGDMDAWVRLANSVKGRLHMRLAYAPGENTQQRAQAALDALALGIRSPDQAPTVSYQGDTGYQQPWYAFETSSEGTGIRTRSSRWYIEMLKADEDPRLPIMANPADWWCPAYGEQYTPANDCTPVRDLGIGPIYRGNPSGGVGEPDSAISRLGSFFTADSADHVWFTYEDTKFLEAEARLLVSGAAAADAPYREGIRANMERLGVAQAAIETYLASRPPLGTAGNPLEEIITEKFKANFLRDEVWHDYRRTGFPQPPPPLQPLEHVLPGIPLRLRTPASELQYNAESVAATGIPITLEGKMVPVWWASGSPPSF